MMQQKFLISFADAFGRSWETQTENQLRESVPQRYTSFMRHAVIITTLLWWVAATAHADIYEWRDANGNRHFTNSLVNVPAAQQPDARVVVTASVQNESSSAPAGPPAEASRAEAPVARTEAQVVYDYSQQRDPYTQGLEDGLALARSASPSNDGDVYINGPLAVANADPYVAVTSPYPYYYPQYPLVTTSFDRGRSRHQTLRMLLQDQFQLDRDGPYVYQRALPPPAGPSFRVVLPRGLPHDRVRQVGPQAKRVTTR